MAASSPASAGSTTSSPRRSGCRERVRCSALPSTRNAGAESNIRWSYGHATIPRHLKDVVITEYGIADLRGRTDRDTAAAMIGLADGRFQEGLVADAVRARKLEKGFRPVPNDAAALRFALAPFRDVLPAYPFGTELTETEQRLAPALRHLKERRGDRSALARLAWSGVRAQLREEEHAALRRMRLEGPADLRERGLRAVLAGALVATRRA